MVTEYHSHGSLGENARKLNHQYKEYNLKCIKDGRGDEMKTFGMKTSQVRLYTIDMIKALHYCHKEINLLHRDIKPDNIMLNHNDEAVLIDFGVSALT